MGLSIGIVGLPNVGKSTLFNALTKQTVDAANYPFCTIDPSVGIVPVPDDRLHKLSELSASEKTISAVVEFVDIAGLVAGASRGEGLGNKFLAHIREVDAIAQVVRIFDDGNITHVHETIDPMRDIEIINTELILADLEAVIKRLGSLEREAKSGDKEAQKLHETLQRIQEALADGRPARSVELAKEEVAAMKGLTLLTHKPVIYILNTKEEVAIPDSLRDFVTQSGAEYVVVNAKVEEEIKEIEGEERVAFRTELGAGHSNFDELISKSYQLLDLITFFTTGEKETRAWTTARGATAPQAGESIHTDFKEKFIRASVIFWKDLIKAGSYAQAREQGLVRTEGKEYVVQDGDVIEFKI